VSLGSESDSDSVRGANSRRRGYIRFQKPGLMERQLKLADRSHEDFQYRGLYADYNSFTQHPLQTMSHAFVVIGRKVRYQKALLMLVFLGLFFVCAIRNGSILVLHQSAIGSACRKLTIPQPVLSSPATCGTKELGGDPASNTVPFAAAENTTYRIPDSLDTFAHYRFRSHSSCQISSLDLHRPFAPLCQTRQDFLHAFSGGGRIGFNTPFMPRGCDMRWFSTEEVCEIFSRFERIIVVGDSMMRHVVGALNVLLRADLGYGAVTNWNFSEQEL